jgi:hypothetical protein
MFFNEPLPFVKEFVEELNDKLEEYEPGHGLSCAQRRWLSFCLMGIVITNTVCWAKFERAGLGKSSLAALSWVFRYSKIPWESLLSSSGRVIVSKDGIREGYLVSDDSEKRRSKSTKRIYGVHQQKDKKTGGYIMGQEPIVLLLVTKVVTIPVGFSFYRPDPVLTAWRKEEKKLRKQGIAKGIAKKRLPPQPSRSPAYPTKAEIVLTLLEQFKYRYAEIKVKLVAVDALYGTGDFMEKASRTFGGVQVLSQWHSHQNVRFRNKLLSVEKYFNQSPGVPQDLKISGDQQVKAYVSSARLYVEAHQKKRFVVALKYEGEPEYRYLVATDLSWRTIDIVQGYTLRWLVEVFFEDWKLYEGWGQLTKQPDEEGSSRGLILSLLLDHCLLCHPAQLARLENKLPAATVGSLQQRTRMESLLALIRDLLSADNPEEKLNLLTKTLEDVFQLAPSKKHMNNRDLGRLEPTGSLAYRAKMAYMSI